jgi:hypothetical protein
LINNLFSGGKQGTVQWQTNFGNNWAIEGTSIVLTFNNQYSVSTDKKRLKWGTQLQAQDSLAKPFFPGKTFLEIK